MKAALVMTLPGLASSFVVSQVKTTPTTSTRKQTSSASNVGHSDDEPESDGLLLSGLDQEMTKVASKYSFTESEFLAAARKRAEMRVESSNAGATDEEWHSIANEKKQQYGDIDDWENSMKEAGNTDSKILMFTEPSDDNESENGEGGQPKLLLF